MADFLIGAHAAVADRPLLTRNHAASSPIYLAPHVSPQRG
jgi:predicted nucleic acid-binding protein